MIKKILLSLSASVLSLNSLACESVASLTPFDEVTVSTIKIKRSNPETNLPKYEFCEGDVVSTNSKTELAIRYFDSISLSPLTENNPVIIETIKDCGAMCGVKKLLLSFIAPKTETTVQARHRGEGSDTIASIVLPYSFGEGNKEPFYIDYSRKNLEIIWQAKKATYSVTLSQSDKSISKTVNSMATNFDISEFNKDELITLEIKGDTQLLTKNISYANIPENSPANDSAQLGYLINLLLDGDKNWSLEVLNRLSTASEPELKVLYNQLATDSNFLNTLIYSTTE
ncbi:hypothetical protein [Thalassotalea litorea]|uniref:hypothetical protein n=1 Tax=Thalassotalea litorea TaxID=2020715 RepID=UPI0037355FA8